MYAVTSMYILMYSGELKVVNSPVVGTSNVLSKQKSKTLVKLAYIKNLI